MNESEYLIIWHIHHWQEEILLYVKYCEESVIQPTDSRPTTSSVKTLYYRQHLET